MQNSKLNDDIYVWLLNTSSNAEHVKFKIADEYSADGVCETFWLDGNISYIDNNKYTANISGKGAIIFNIKLN